MAPSDEGPHAQYGEYTCLSLHTSGPGLVRCSRRARSTMCAAADEPQVIMNIITVTATESCITTSATMRAVTKRPQMAAVLIHGRPHAYVQGGV